MKKLVCLLTFIIIVHHVFSQAAKQRNENLIGLVQEIREAGHPSRVNTNIKKIVKSGISFDSVFQLIQSDIFYLPRAKTGFEEWNYQLDSLDYFCYLFIPSSYSIHKSLPVSVILHGAVLSYDPYSLKGYLKKDSYNPDSLNRIIVYPGGWIQSPWWNSRQVENLKILIRKLKLVYNIDENNVHLAGISDGGTGAVYQASLNATPWASFRPYISHPLALGELGDHAVFLKNLKTRPFLFISSENDELFPPQLIESFLKKMKQAGNKFDYYLAKGFKHEVAWLPQYKDVIEKFVEQHSRNPYPNELIMQTDDVKYGRNSWIIIDKLKLGHFEPNPQYPIIEPVSKKFTAIAGSLKVHREGNVIHAETDNIRQYTLLLSPQQFDFDKEFEIYTNGQLSFKGKLTKDLSVLLKWYNKDLDRKMLIGNEVSIKVNKY